MESFYQSWETSKINQLQSLVGSLYATNPNVAQQIASSADLQLRLLDYYNQFGDPQQEMKAWLNGGTAPSSAVAAIPPGGTLDGSMINQFIMYKEYSTANAAQKASENDREARLQNVLCGLDPTLGPSYIDVAGACADPLKFDNSTIHFLSGFVGSLVGGGDNVILDPASTIGISDPSMNMRTWNGIGNPARPDTVTAPRSGQGVNIDVKSGGDGSVIINSTGANISVESQNAQVNGNNTVVLNGGAAQLNDGSVSNVSGTGTVYASYGTVNTGANSNLKLVGNNESSTGDATDNPAIQGVDNVFAGANAILNPLSFTDLTVLGSNSIFANVGDVGIFASNSSFLTNTNGLSDLNFFGTNNTIGGSGQNDYLNIFGTYNSNSLNNTSVSYYGSTSGDTNSGTVLAFWDYTAPDAFMPITSLSFDDPIVLNLSGGKVQTQNLVGSSAYFDVQNNGQRVHTGWGTAGEGYLVYDPAGKNTVANEQSLVASFAALKALDKNNDGVLNAQDSAWASLKVWVDNAGTGAFTSGSLMTMDQIGIASINLNSTHVNQNQNNNTILDDSTFTWKSGGTGDIAGVDFNFHSSSVITVRGGGGGGGGGGGTCVHIASLLPDGRTAGEVAVGEAMLLADEKTLHPGVGVVSYSEKKLAKGYRIEAEGGFSLLCSDTAPIPTPQGLVLAPDLVGHYVAVRKDEAGSSLVGWSKVTAVIAVGDIEVQHITVGDKCFWAGDRPGLFILHHNRKNLP